QCLVWSLFFRHLPLLKCRTKFGLLTTKIVLHNHCVKRHSPLNQSHHEIAFVLFVRLTSHSQMALIDWTLVCPIAARLADRPVLIVHYAVSKRHLDTANYVGRPDINSSLTGKVDAMPYHLGNWRSMEYHWLQVQPAKHTDNCLHHG